MILLHQWLNQSPPKEEITISKGLEEINDVLTLGEHEVGYELEQIKGEYWFIIPISQPLHFIDANLSWYI